MDNPIHCPHCGKQPAINYGRNTREVWAYINCTCGATQRPHRGKTDKEARASAVEAWNMRVNCKGD